MNLSNPFEFIVYHPGTCVFFTVKVKEGFTLEAGDFVWLPTGIQCLLIDTNGVVLSEVVKEGFDILPNSPLGLYFTCTNDYAKLVQRKLEYLNKKFDFIGTDIRLTKVGDFIIRNSLGVFKKVTEIVDGSPPKIYEDNDFVAHKGAQNRSFTVFRSKEKEV